MSQECCERLKAEVRACKKRAEDAHGERDALGEQLSAVSKQLAAAADRAAAVDGQLAAVTGQLAAAAAAQAKLEENADDMAEAYERRLAELSERRDRLAAEQCEQYDGRLVELAKKHADELRRLTAEHGERHADELRRVTGERDRELRRLTDELDAVKSSWTREVEDLRQALHELNARAQADKSAAVECAAAQRASIDRLTALLPNKCDLDRELEVLPAAAAAAAAVDTELDRPSSSLSSTGCDRAGLPHPSSARVMSRTSSSTDSSVTYDMVRRCVAATAVVSPSSSSPLPPPPPPAAVPCDCCEVDDRPRSSACHRVCATVDSTSDSTDCAAVNDHPSPPPPPPPVNECGDVIDDPVENGQLRASPGQCDNYYASAVTCDDDDDDDDDDVHVMRLLEKYKYNIEADAERSSTTDE